MICPLICSWTLTPKQILITQLWLLKHLAPHFQTQMPVFPSLFMGRTLRLGSNNSIFPPSLMFCFCTYLYTYDLSGAVPSKQCHWAFSFLASSIIFLNSVRQDILIYLHICAWLLHQIKYCSWTCLDLFAFALFYRVSDILSAFQSSY